MVNEIAHLKLNLGEKTTLNPLAVKRYSQNGTKIGLKSFTIYNLQFTIYNSSG